MKTVTVTCVFLMAAAVAVMAQEQKPAPDSDQALIETLNALLARVEKLEARPVAPPPTREQAEKSVQGRYAAILRGQLHLRQICKAQGGRKFSIHTDSETGKTILVCEF